MNINKKTAFAIFCLVPWTIVVALVTSAFADEKKPSAVIEHEEQQMFKRWREAITPATVVDFTEPALVTKAKKPITFKKDVKPTKATQPKATVDLRYVEVKNPEPTPGCIRVRYTENKGLKPFYYPIQEGNGEIPIATEWRIYDSDTGELYSIARFQRVEILTGVEEITDSPDQLATKSKFDPLSTRFPCEQLARILEARERGEFAQR